MNIISPLVPEKNEDPQSPRFRWLDKLRSDVGVRIANVSGTVTLVGGTATVNNKFTPSTGGIFLTSQVDGGTPGFLRVSSRVTGTSFTITSSSGTDTSTVGYLIIPPF